MGNHIKNEQKVLLVAVWSNGVAYKYECVPVVEDNLTQSWNPLVSDVIFRFSAIYDFLGIYVFCMPFACRLKQLENNCIVIVVDLKNLLFQKKKNWKLEFWIN